MWWANRRHRAGCQAARWTGEEKEEAEEEEEARRLLGKRGGGAEGQRQRDRRTEWTVDPLPAERWEDWEDWE